MLNDPLPQKIDPRKLAERDVTLSGEIPLPKFLRLAESLCSTEGYIVVDIHFTMDEQRLRIVTGHVQGKVQMICQRCLHPVDFNVNASINLALVYSDEQAKKLPDDYDPLFVEEDIALVDVIEDELILSLPLVPTHEDCSVQTTWGEAQLTTQPQEKPNPFNVLASLKK